MMAAWPEDRISPAELAVAADCLPDALARYIELGLLRADPDQHFGRDDVSRARLLVALEAAGLDHEGLAKAAREGVISLAFAGQLQVVTVGLNAQTLEEAIRSLGISHDFAQRLQLALGLPAIDASAPVREDDLEIMTMAAAALRQGVREEDILPILRVFAVCMRQVALAMRDFFRSAVEEPRLAQGLSHRDMLHDSAPLRLVFQRMGFRAVQVLLGRYLEQATMENVIARLLDGLADVGITEAVSRIRTIVFADLSGFTQLTEERGDVDAAEVSARFGEIVQTTCAQHGGRLVKLLGDGAMLEFRNGRSAMACATRLLEEVRRGGLPAARAGLASGPVVARDGDAFGQTVNLAARLVAAAPAGGIWLAADAVPNLDNCNLSVLGPTTLRGLSRPVEVVEWRAMDACAEARPG